MSEANISRRDALRLARFGALLSAGLGLVEACEAGQVYSSQGSRTVKELPSMTVKLYNGSSLVKSIPLPSGSQAATHIGGTQFMIKLWSPKKTYANITTVLVKGGRTDGYIKD